jgi:hypothetical protein
MRAAQVPGQGRFEPLVLVAAIGQPSRGPDLAQALDVALEWRQQRAGDEDRLIEGAGCCGMGGSPVDTPKGVQGLTAARSRADGEPAGKAQA